MVNDLHRVTSGRIKGCAQGFMPSHNLGYATFQSPFIQLYLQAYGYGHVIGTVSRLQLVKEPETLLGEGKWQISLAGYGNNERDFLVQIAAEELLDTLRKISNGRSFKQAT